MLNTDIVNLANDRIELELLEKINRLNNDIVRCVSELGPFGVTPSGSTGKKRISELCAKAIMDCVQKSWETLHRFVTNSGVKYSEELAFELKNIVGNHLPENLSNFKECLQPYNLGSVLEGNLSNTRNHALRKIGTEIDLFVQYLRNIETMAATKKDAPIFNIYSPVGAIQTGENAVTHVTQNIDSEKKEQLMKVLVSLEESIQQIVSLPNHPKEEIIELIQEGQSEIRKESPNVTKIRSLLSTVGNSIQVVSSLKPVYENLKTVLTYIGITLP